MKFNAADGKPRLETLKQPKSTTTILWRYFMLFTLAILLIIGITMYAVLGNMATTRSRQRVQRVGEEFTELLSKPVVNEHELKSRIADYSLHDSIDVFIFDGDGNSEFESLTVEGDAMVEMYGALTSNMGEWESGKYKVYSTRSGSNVTLNYGGCVVFRGKNCTLLVRYVITTAVQTLRLVELYMLFMLLGGLILALFVSYVLAKKLSNPISDVSQTAQKLAKGDYGVQFNSVEYKEIAELSDTLNYMKDEIKKSDEFQKELLANVSHDLKTPLTMIKAYASMIQEISGNDPEKRNKHLQVIIDEADRLTGLVNDILSTSKLRSGIEQIDRKVFNASELVYGVIDSFGYLQEGQGYSIMVDIDPNQYTSGDEEKIKQVVYNFISNAVNYTGADKTIYVSLKFVPQDNCLRFTVRDTGKGIPPEELEHIWERYYRSGDTHARPVKGTGLGLNIVKTILDAHDFKYGVNSKEGEGSSFFVEFPAVSSDPDRV